MERVLIPRSHCPKCILEIQKGELTEELEGGVIVHKVCPELTKQEPLEEGKGVPVVCFGI